MKALIGGAAGVAALGGALLLANTRTTSSAVQANPAQTVASTSALAQTGPTYVDCGPGRIAMFRPALAGQAGPQVECVVSPYAAAQGFVEPNMLAAPGQYPVQAQQPVVQERIVYRDRPVTRTVARSTPRRTVAYRTAAPAEVRQGRSWKKSALIIGGAAAGGAGVGAILGGGSGAKKGAVVGGIGGLVYDLATRNK
jgi:hypothetical protein